MENLSERLLIGEHMIEDLADLIRNHNIKKKSFEKVKIGKSTFIKHIKNGNTYFEYDEHPDEKECEIKKFMNEQIKYLNWMLSKELERRKHDEDTCN